MNNTEDKQENRQYTHKVGIKILSDIQLKNVLPSYGNLFAKIENCRKVASAELVSEEHKDRHYQYNFMYDNVFSILGKRGTGKTSVAFTLREEIRKRQEAANYDVVLPLVIPEVIPENCTILGWLLAIVKEQISELEEDIQKLEKKRNGDKSPSQFGYYGNWKDRDSLTDKLDEISQMFFAGSYNPSNESSYHRAIDNSIQQAEDYYNFAKKIVELWDKWIERILEYYRMETKGQSAPICPMIYFVFDDVDLAPDKISELLSVIIKYLSHPNLIVIVTAEENLFLQVIENQLDKKIGRIPREWREYLSLHADNRFELWNSNVKVNEMSNEDVVNQTAAMYLGKVLPPSTRYYLRLFHTAKEKQNFYVEENKHLWRAIYEKIDEMINCMNYTPAPHNFMQSHEIPIRFYLNFFGDTSRQISNVYIALNELVDSLEGIIGDVQKGDVGTEDCMNRLYYACRYFLRVALVSNHDLAKVIGSVQKFVDEVLLYEYNQWRFYINYSYINEFLEEEVDDRQIKVRVVLQLYSLLAFMENILLLMEYAFPENLTGRRKIHVVSFMTEYIQSIAFDDRHIFRDDLAAALFFEHYDNLLDRMESIVEDESRSDMKFRLAYFYDFRNYGISYESKSQGNETTVTIKKLKDIARQNPLWFKELVGMLTMVYGNAYLFDKKDMADCLLFRGKRYLVRYQRKIRNELQEYIDGCFGFSKLQDVWEDREWKEYIEYDYSEPDEKNNGFYELVEKVKNEIIIEKQLEEWRNPENIQDNNTPRDQEEENLWETGRDAYCFVDLRMVVETVLAYLDIDKYMDDVDSLQEMIRQCPYDIARELVANLKNVRSDKELAKRMLADRIASIEQIEYGWNGLSVLIDFVSALDVFERLYKIGGPRYKTLKDIATEISTYTYGLNDFIPEVDKGKMVLIDKELYRKLYNELNRVLEISDNDRYINENLEPLLNETREIFMTLDLGVDIYDNYEISRAVRLGMEVAVVGVLQQIYFFQTVHERYVNRNSLSSRELEQVDRKHTYYYNFFNQVRDVLDNAGAVKGDIDLREKIRQAFAYERHRYVEQLIAGAENE